MSAPQQGRQSPDPENQSDSQKAQPSSGHDESAPSGDHTKQSSEDTKHHGLESNPVHPLEEAAKEKISKTT